MNFLNSDKYYNRILNVEIQNLKIKMEADSGIIAQIDGFLSTFSNNLQGPKSSNMVYYNENTQLNDVIQTKNNLITEQGKLRMDLANIDKIIKENSRTTNIINKEFINGKLKFILPIIFISLYLFGLAFFNFYKKQAKKLVK